MLLCAFAHRSDRLGIRSARLAAATSGNNRCVDAPLTIALAQTNPTTGDLDGNAAAIDQMCSEAARSGAGLVLFPELALTGYGADDLFLRRDFVEAGAKVLAELASGIEGITALIGYAEPLSGAPTVPPNRHIEGISQGGPVAANSVAVIRDGRVSAAYRKRTLARPGGVDQPGRFLPGDAPFSFEASDATIGVLAGSEFTAAPTGGPGVLAVAGASPYIRGGAHAREQALVEAARNSRSWLAHADFAGGQDELLFEGASSLISPEGDVVARAGQFSEQLVIASIEAEPAPWFDDIEELYVALVTGIRDYVLKNGFERVGLGLSGGLDSALVAALAADALGPDRLSAVIMPSRFSAGESQSDAREMAARLGCETIELAIEGPMTAYEDLLGDDAAGIASENLQARIRGNLLMALSNRRGWLVLVTSNKSEAAVGYSTLYGDMAGGFAPIQDVPKTVAFELCRYRNGISPVIPESIIERPPSAELSPDQKDSDALPEYEVLDRILRRYIEEGASAAQLVESGEDAGTVAEVVALVDRSEFKRRQAPPGLRVSPVSFARDRQMPLTSGFAAGLSPTASRRI